MFLRRRVKELEEANEMCNKDFDHVYADMANVARDLREVRSRFNKLRYELATNGVISDIRNLQKRVAYLEDENRKLKTNGVATAINKLNDEVFKTRKDKKDGIYTYSFLHSLIMNGESTEKEEEATLAGKVDAIIAYLGLDVTVKPEEVSEAKVIAKKVTTKKKGKK